MKRLFLFTTLISVLFSCSKTNSPKSELERSSSLLTLSLRGQLESKAAGSGQGNQSDDNYINTLDIFVFHADGENIGELDAYKRFTATDGVNNLQVKATTGNKIIYAVANSHRSDWNGVVSLTKFQQITTSLQQDDLKDFIMIGEVRTTLQVATSIAIPISRLTARIRVSSIKTSFAGTPYQGTQLSNVKVWVLNAHSVKKVHNGLADSDIILNNKRLEATDVNACAMPGMLYDAIGPQISDAGYTTPHYFYTYENVLENETTDNRFTRLIIQADLNGKTYYYPVNVNQDGYGHVAGNGHKGVKRNTSYEMNVTILRPGSTDPDKPVEHGTLAITLDVQNWATTPVVNPEF